MLPSHYLVIVVTDRDFRYALIQVRLQEGKVSSLRIDDLGWLDVDRIRGNKNGTGREEPFSRKRKAEEAAIDDSDQIPGSPSR